MTEIIYMTILTKSPMRIGYSDGGFCIAGMGFNSDWVRLIVNNENSNVPTKDFCVYSDGIKWKPLDYVKVINENFIPPIYQKENKQIDTSRSDYIKKIKECSFSDFIRLYKYETHNLLFGTRNEFVNIKDRSESNTSLTLIPVEKIKFYESHNRKTKAKFIHNDREYKNLSVTEKFNSSKIKYIRKNKDNLSGFCVVSLTREPIHGKFYKIIAQTFFKGSDF